MRAVLRWSVSVLLVTSLVTLGSLNAWAVRTYDIADLGVISPGAAEYSRAVSLNDLGQATGYSLYDAGGGHTYDHAFRWDLTGTPRMESLPAFGGIASRSSYGTHINSAGTVVGSADNGTGVQQAAVWIAGQTDPIPLGTLNGSDGASCAYGVNDTGRVVGQSWDGSMYRGFVWRQGEGMTALPTLGGTGGPTQAYAVNSTGSIVGQSWDGSTLRAFLYKDDTMWGLPAISNALAPSEGFAINSAGRIGGYSYTGSVPDPTGTGVGYHACYWDGVAAPTEIGTLGGVAGNSYVWGMNDAGAMVGYSEWTPDGTRAIHAYIYENDQMYDLNSLIREDSGWELYSAYDINSSGQIVGFGTLNDVEHAYLLSPTPELSPALLLLVGMLPVGVAWWRRRRAWGP